MDFTTFYAPLTSELELTPTLTVANSLTVVNSLKADYYGACEARESAYRLYAEMCDRYSIGKIDRETLEAQYAAAAGLEARTSVLYTAWQLATAAYLESQECTSLESQECTCTPIYDCPVCADRARQTPLEEIF